MGTVSQLSLGAWRFGGSPVKALPEPVGRSREGKRVPSSGDDSLTAAIRDLRSACAGEEAFAVLDARVRPRLLAYFRADSASRQEAEDLAQRTLARVAAGIARLRAEESFLPWLFTIARNVRLTAREQHRRAARVVAGGMDVAGDPPDPRPTPLESGLARERVTALQAAIASLPAQQRQCFLLRVDRELSYEEIAATLGLSVHTVRNHLAMARKSLREALP